MIDITEGIDLFNDCDFFNAHDYFEDLWNKAEFNDRLFYQGMVQVSVGCFHLISGNNKGALSQFTKGTAKLINYVPIYSGVNIRKLIIDIFPLIYGLERFYEGDEMIIDEKIIPKIEYNYKITNV